jgi:hypothetical protein
VASNATPKTPTTNLAPIDLEKTPKECHPIAKQAAAPALAVALAARISLASCLADVALAPLHLLDCEVSKLDVEAAAAPSFALLDETIAATPDLATQIIAEHAKAELYGNMLARMEATIPPSDGTDASNALRNIRKGLLEAVLAPWREAKSISHDRVLALVKKDPKLEKNPVVASAARTARQHAQVAAATHTEQPEPAPSAPQNELR